jgi:mannose-1-phosphate guanylyltransferase
LKAAVLAAGLGTRLRPLTDLRPKPLLPVLNRPLLGLLLKQLEDGGFGQVAVNTHHLAGLVQDFLQAQPWSFYLSVRHEPEILGTGGGLKGLGESLGGGPFLAINGDILTDLDLTAIHRRHRPEAITTLVLHDCPPYNNVWVVAGAVVSVGQTPPGKVRPPLAYTGVQVVGKRMLDYLPAGGYHNLVHGWRAALVAGERLAALVVSGHFWQDLGTPEGYLAAHRRLLRGEAPGLARYFPDLADPLLGPGAVVGPGVRFGPGVCLGAGVEVGAGAFLENTVVWERARLAPGVELRDCIVAATVPVAHTARGQVVVS